MQLHLPRKEKEKTNMSTSKRHLLAVLSNSERLGELMVVKDVAPRDDLDVDVGGVGDDGGENDVVEGSHEGGDGLQRDGEVAG